ncbi:MAG: Maf family protein [Myxococcota bacterium]
MRFILGSSSPRRRELLAHTGIEFEIIKPDIDESPKEGESPVDFVRRASGEKLFEILKKKKFGRETIILTADTIVVIDNKILGKPINKRDAFRMLKLLQGRWHIVYTAFSLYYKSKIITRVVKTDVRFRELTDGEIKKYIESDEPMDKAGAYAAQGIGATIIKEIRGSYTNVIGLPVAEVIQELKRLKVQPES